MRKLPWSDAEIACDYRTAADPAAQIKILAELNATDEDTIREALAREGIHVPAKRGRKKKQQPTPEQQPETPEAKVGFVQIRDQPPTPPGVLTVYPDPDADEDDELIPQGEVKEVFLSILQVLEAVPEWATKYTRDKAGELAMGIMRDFIELWKVTEVTIPAAEDAEGAGDDV